MVRNNQEWANRFNNFELKYEYRLVDYGPEPEKILMERIKAKGRMKWDDERYIKELDSEMDIMVNNKAKNVCPYFLPIQEIAEHYNKNKWLVGPARGSAGSWLVSYLLGITQMDPIKYKLPASRFATKDRLESGSWMDIDFDACMRSPLVGEDGNSGYLNDKYGKKFAQISTRTLLRLKSAVLDANRFINGGEIEEEVQAFSKSLPNAPQGVSDSDFIFGYENSEGEHIEGILEKSEELQQYAIKRPTEWEIVKKAVSLVRQRSRHACSYVIADIDIDEIVPTMQIGTVKKVTQYEAKQCEGAGLVKYDFLTIAILLDMMSAIDLINKKYGHTDREAGYFIHKGKRTYIWDLPDEEHVYDSLARGETETIFQLSTQTVTPYVVKIKPKSIPDIATIQALCRPGCLDFVDPITQRNMVEEYVYRKNGLSSCPIEILNKMLPDTYGVIIFQEDLSRIAKELGGMSVEDAENVRIGMGKKQIKVLEALKPKFISGASKKISQEEAEKIWDMMFTFASYGFNLGHATAYAMISYGCAFIKENYPLEWWAGVLTNAESTEINEVLYKYIRTILTPPDINLSEESMVIDYERSKIRSKLSILNGISDNLSAKIQAGRPYLDIKDFVKKRICGETMTKKLIHIGVMDSILPDVNLEEKIRLANQAFIDVAYDEKIEKGIKAKAPKIASCDPDYLMLSDLKDFQMKKAVYPTMNLDLDYIMNKETMVERSGEILAIGGKKYTVKSSDYLKAVEDKIMDKNMDFAVAGYVLELDYFTYANDTKKACKLIIDSSGYVAEKVIWPNKDTNILTIYKFI